MNIFFLIKKSYMEKFRKYKQYNFLNDPLVLRENYLTFWNFLLVFFSVYVYVK